MPRWLKVTLIVLLLLVFAAAGVVAGYLFRGCLAKGGTGTVKVTSVPSDAKVELDGRDTGRKTPASLGGVKAGKHALTISKDGYVDWKTVVTVEAGKDTAVDAVLVKAVAREEEEASPDTTPPPTPSQLAPPDGASLTGRPIVPPTTYEWSQVSDASGVTYSFESQFFMFTEWHPNLTVNGLTTTSLVLAPKAESQRWRVWAVDGAGNESDRSPWWATRMPPE